MISDAAFVFVVLNGTYVPAGLLRSDGRSGFFFASVADVERILEDMCEIVENWEERFVQCGVKE